MYDKKSDLLDEGFHRLSVSADLLGLWRRQRRILAWNLLTLGLTFFTVLFFCLLFGASISDNAQRLFPWLGLIWTIALLIYLLVVFNQLLVLMDGLSEKKAGNIEQIIWAHRQLWRILLYFWVIFIGGATAFILMVI